MSYEIPKNLKYQEKIFFNLSIWQTLWITLFGILIWTINIKTILFFEAKIVLSIILGLLGIGFAYLDLKKHLITITNFLFNPKQLGYLDKRLNSFIEVSKIEFDTIFLKNSSSWAILQIQPINFHILSPQQQQAIISSYKDFLNSLDFPIQIVVRTVNLSLDDYLEALEITVKKQKKEILLKQFKDFKEFILEYIEKNSVKNRLFYIVVPNQKNASPNELENRVKVCMEKLKNCNIVTKRLNTNELVTLLSSYFEGTIENAGEYQDFITILEKENVIPNQTLQESMKKMGL